MNKEYFTHPDPKTYDPNPYDVDNEMQIDMYMIDKFTYDIKLKDYITHLQRVMELSKEKYEIDGDDVMIEIEHDCDCTYYHLYTNRE